MVTAEESHCNKTVTISPALRLRGEITPPGDKSISHRSAMLNAMANGVARITNYSNGADCASTVSILRILGVRVDVDDHLPGDARSLTVYGAGMNGLSEPADVLDAGNSGTTTRLMSGILAGRDMLAVLTGDSSIRSRPMGRVIDPLRQMGANISAREDNRLAPIVFNGGDLDGIEYAQSVASAQVKSCLLFAGLRARDITTVRSPAASRDHSERMLSAMGAKPVSSENGAVVSIAPSELSAVDVDVPGDISSAAFWMVAAAVHPDAEIIIRNVGLNPTRTGILTVLRDMSADITIENERLVAGEPAGDLVVRSSNLIATRIQGDVIPLVIDELPVIAVAAAMADGETVIADAEELRVKEADRIEATVNWMRAAGIAVDEQPDGMVIKGGGRLRGVTANSFGDHRIAMSLAVAGLVATDDVTIQDAGAADISYPTFWRDLSTLSGIVA